MNNNFTPIPRTYVNEMTRDKCINSCKIMYDPMTRCNVPSSNPFNLSFNEDFKGASCVINAQNDLSKCVKECDRYKK